MHTSSHTLTHSYLHTRPHLPPFTTHMLSLIHTGHADFRTRRQVPGICFPVSHTHAHTLQAVRHAAHPLPPGCSPHTCPTPHMNSSQITHTPDSQPKAQTPLSRQASPETGHLWPDRYSVIAACACEDIGLMAGQGSSASPATT